MTIIRAGEEEARALPRTGHGSELPVNVDQLQERDKYHDIHSYNVDFSGLSLVSVLLLMSLGLAIIFGLMGVINMAHGEFMILGAYMTYLCWHSSETLHSGCSAGTFSLRCSSRSSSPARWGYLWSG